MTHEQFNNIFQDTMMELERLVDFKGSQYSEKKNRLHNFDFVGQLLNIGRLSDKGYSLSALQACRGMWLKQLVSLLDAISGRDSTWTQERCDEVINDLLVYLILTKAIFYRDYGWEPKSIPLSGTIRGECHHHRITQTCSECYDELGER